MALCIGQTCTESYKSPLLSMRSFPVANEENEAEPKNNETRVAKLTLPDPAFSSYKFPVEESPSAPTTWFDAVKKSIGLRTLSLDWGPSWLSEDLPSAVESYFPSELKFQVGIDALKGNSWSKWSMSVDLLLTGTWHDDANTARFAPMNVDAGVQLIPSEYISFLLGTNLKTSFNQFHSPTFFYPNGQELELFGKGGLQGSIPQRGTSLAVTFGHKHVWGDYEFKNVISDEFAFKGASKHLGVLDIRFLQLFSSPWAPDISAYFTHSFYGKKHAPEALVIGNKTIVNSKTPIDITEISAGFALDWLPFSVSGGYKYQGSEFWPAEHIGSVYAELRTAYGDYGAGWTGLFGVEPTAPVTTHDVQIKIRGPFLNKSVGVNVSFFDDHVYVIPGIDVIRFADHFANNGTRSRAEAPASALASQPAPAPEPESIEFDPTKPNLYRLLKCGNTEAVKEGKGSALDCTNLCKNKHDKDSIDQCVSTWNSIKTTPQYVIVTGGPSYPPSPVGRINPNQTFEVLVGEEKEFLVSGTDLFDDTYTAQAISGVNIIGVTRVNDTTLKVKAKGQAACTSIFPILKGGASVGTIEIEVKQ